MFERFLKTSEAVFNRINTSVENIRLRRIWYAVLCFFVVAICFTSLMLLNSLTPLISDDITYLFIFGETDRITSVYDIIQSQINHYYMWGGRSVVHFVAQLLLMLPPWVADLLNSLMYLIYAFLIYYHIKGRGGITYRYSF